MVLKIHDGQHNGTPLLTRPAGRLHDWPELNSGPWNWPAADPAEERNPAPSINPGSDQGVPWLWQLMSCVANGWAERSGLLRLATATAAQPVRARALNALGRFAWRAGDLTAAQAFYHEALVIGRDLRDQASLSCSLGGLATVALAVGAYDSARSFQDEAITIRRELGDAAGVARSLATLGWLAAERGSDAKALEYLGECLTIRRELGQNGALAFALLHLGWLAFLRHDRAEAGRLLRASHEVVWHLPERWKVTALLGLLGRPPLVGTAVEQALRLLAGAEALDEAAVVLRPEDGERSHRLAEVHGQPSADELAAVWADGHATSVETLIEHALRADPPAVRSGRGDERAVLALTRREREVAALVGQGHTNRRIADELVIAERTVETHTRNIREKLGLATRSQLAAWVAEHRLLPRAEAG